MYSCGPPHMANQKPDDQLEHTYSSYVMIRDVTLKTCQWRWMIGRCREREGQWYARKPRDIMMMMMMMILYLMQERHLIFLGIIHIVYLLLVQQRAIISPWMAKVSIRFTGNHYHLWIIFYFRLNSCQQIIFYFRMNSCQQTSRELETKCGRESHTQPRGSSETPDGVRGPE